jgi:predicted dehydrogenase
MPPKLRVAVVGCGRISRSHLEGIRSLPERIELVGVADTLPDRALATQEEYGARKRYASGDEALEDDEVEAVVLCLPNDLHYRVSLQALDHGKHVLVEKPMALTASEADEMVAAAKRADRRLMVGQSRRFYNAVMKSIELIRSGAIGHLVHVSVSWLETMTEVKTPWWSSAAQAGGLLIGLQGPHVVDYVLWAYGRKPARVYAETFSNQSIWEGEDEVSSVMGFDKGGIATVQLSWNLRQQASSGHGEGEIDRPWSRYERIIIGSEGTILVKGETAVGLNGEPIAVEPQPLSNFALQLIEFADSIQEDREPLTSGSVVRDTIEVLDAMRTSAREGRAVHLDG